MQSNKGRFKCPHEAQAVWNLYATMFTGQSEEGEPVWEGELFWYCKDYPDRLSTDLHVLAINLHKARLIHGTIYDEDGRIEDKDVAQAVALLFEESDGWNIDGLIRKWMLSGQILGTIFY